MPAAIAFEGVGFAYGARTVFADLSLGVGPGEVLGLLGRNGAGKTTWLKLACGLLQPARGAVMLAGRSLREVRRQARSRAVALVFHDLSAGERQRVLLAMALAQEPRILLLDEPTAHLDAAHQVWAFELVRRLNREAGLTVVAAVHDLQHAAWFCSRLAVLDGGAVAADGPPAAVMRGPRVAQALGISLEVRPGSTPPGHHVITLPEDAQGSVG